MKSRFNQLTNPNVLKTIPAALLLAMGGTACSASSETPAPACAVSISSGDTLSEISADSGVFDDNRDGVAEIKAINTGIDAGRLALGDDVALSAKMCEGLADSDVYYKITELDGPDKQ